MPAVEAKLEYEREKNTYQSIEIHIEEYHLQQSSMFSDGGQKKLTASQRKPDMLQVRFYILTYANAILENGTITKEKVWDAREETAKIKKLLQNNAVLHRQPICILKWGEEAFQGFLTDLDYQYTTFLENGIPVCASFQAVFQETLSVDAQLQNDNTNQSPDRSKYRVVYEKTQLYQMAYREYDDPGKWRAIAEANQMEDPLDLVPGTLLTLPPLSEEEYGS